MYIIVQLILKKKTGKAKENFQIKESAPKEEKEESKGSKKQQRKNRKKKTRRPSPRK